MNDIKKTIVLTNVSIKKKDSVKGEEYYMIIDQNADRAAYFCFQNLLKNDWEDLTQHYQVIKEIEFEYYKNDLGNKVTRILHHDHSEGILI
ncbi:hypothetical protein [endosymbiont GvMRE of Glomus versiforme]|uniref:hypothetical protein n=1 Tax=endosymbiont GvMRE of Glomus versiforme TaxID=2039283 RepID=UPI000EBA7955|nr:hypothetical protein [endosymbiont GvMRE of Glomus versiforme]RHZ35581.1 hypothetical protein GvMRE_IIg336 [endosymbiont GvMRE of Glomus versiforme]